MSDPILFLDFDGVLHPDQAYMHDQLGIVLKTANLPAEYENADLFCYMPALENMLADYPEVRIVLSTSWVGVIGYTPALAHLPMAIQQRVIGATEPREGQTRYQQILDYLSCHPCDRWLALDNDAYGWPADYADHLVLTDDYKGIADPAAVADLRRKLEQL